MNQQELAEQRLRKNEADQAMWQERARQQVLAELSPGINREEGVELLAWCGNVLAGCSDEQHPVTGTRITTNVTYGMQDPGCLGEPIGRQIENSSVSWDFNGDDGRYCERCGAHRHLGEQVRPTYLPRSGHDQRGLIKIAQGWLRDGLRPPLEAGAVTPGVKPDDRVDALEKELVELKALVAGNGHSAPSESPVDPPAAATAPPGGVKGVRKRGEGRYEALLYRSETEDGSQRSLGTFDTPEEAAAAREAALS